MDWGVAELAFAVGLGPSYQMIKTPGALFLADERYYLGSTANYGIHIKIWVIAEKRTYRSRNKKTTRPYIELPKCAYAT